MLNKKREMLRVFCALEKYFVNDKSNCAEKYGLYDKF